MTLASTVREAAAPLRRHPGLRRRRRLDAVLRRARPALRRASPPRSRRAGSATATWWPWCCRRPPTTSSPTPRRPSSAPSPPASTPASPRHERAAVLAVARPALVVTTDELAPDDRVPDGDGLGDGGWSGGIGPAHHPCRRASPPLLAELIGPPTPPRPAAPAPTPTTPSASSPWCSPRAPPARPKGAMFGHRELAAITASDVGDRWGGGGRDAGLDPVRPRRVHDQAAWYLRLGTTTHLLDRWRAMRRPAPGRRAPHGQRRRRRPAGRAAAPRPGLRPLRPVERADASSWAAPRRRRRWCARPASASARRTRSATRPPSPAASAPAPPSTPTTTRPSSPSAAPGRRRDRDPRRATGRPVPDGTVGELCLRSSCMMRGYWNDPDAHRRGAARRLAPHRRPRP